MLRAHLLRAGLALLLLLAPAAAQETLPPEAQAEIRGIIERQIAALAAKDAAAAYGLAAPIFRARYGTAARFLEGVQKDFGPIVGPRNVTWEDLSNNAGRPVQKLLVVGADGKAAFVYFSMEKQANGVWRVAALAVTPIEGRGI